MLNVCRSPPVKLLEEGMRPFHKTGKHRRLRFADLKQTRAPLPWRVIAELFSFTTEDMHRSRPDARRRWGELRRPQAAFFVEHERMPEAQTCSPVFFAPTSAMTASISAREGSSCHDCDAAIVVNDSLLASRGNTPPKIRPLSRQVSTGSA